MKLLIIYIAVLFAIAAGVMLWRYRPRPVRLVPALNPTLYVYIGRGGLAYELEADQVGYLSKPYYADDGARPALKSSYDSINYNGSQQGYLERELLPSNIEVRALDGLVTVKTAEQAAAIAVAGFSESIGVLGARPDKPFEVELNAGVWCVKGTWLSYGGVREAYVSAATGRLIRYGKYGPPELKVSYAR